VAPRVPRFVVWPASPLRHPPRFVPASPARRRPGCIPVPCADTRLAGNGNASYKTARPGLVST